ncbi:cell wall-binding repeat-containing protein [Clostridium ihumii]|uniref:cell wall-binding repeat-containing protein n=1 Tax=Clostridium ihumii TaxID=1470356 RepID=UPI003D334F56
MKKSSRVISTLLLGATLTTFSTGVFAVESQKVVKEKLAGATRYETNLAVSAKWEKAETVILVEGYAIPDALAATPLAKQKDAPILLTETAKLTKATADEITRLGAKNAIIVGGEGVVSKEVEKDLEAMNVKVTRLAGQSRFETSEAVVKEMGEVSKVAVVNGYGESDALSIAAPAAKEGMAIVLAGKDELKGSADVVKNAKEKYVIGGEGVVSEKLEKEIGAERLGGATRNETNAAILDKFYSEKEIENLYVAKDGNPKTTELVDALGVGPLAGKEGNPVMLAGAKLSDGQAAYLKDKTAKTVTEVGNGINASTLTDIVKALEVKDVTPEPSDKVEVEGVKVINANQLEVKFNQKVDKDSAEIIGNYEVKKDGEAKDMLKAVNYQATSAVAAANANNAIDGTAEVQEDGQTVLITLPQAYLDSEANFFNQETVRVKVENVMNEAKNEVMDKYENKSVRLFDNVLPELKAVKQVGPKDFDLVFSEPVTATNSSAIVSAIRIDGGKYSCTAKTRVNAEGSKIDANVVRITTSTEVEAGEHNITIKENKLTDYAGLKLEATEGKFEAKKATEDLVASVYKTSGKTVTVDFNREVENAETAENTNVSYYLDYQNANGEANGYKAEEAKMKNGKLVLTFNRDIPSGNHKILVVYGSEKKDKVQDLWETELASREIAFTVAKDEVAPTATVSYNKNDKKIEIKFSKKVEKSEAEKVSNYTLKDSKGNFKNIAAVSQKEGNSLVYTINAENLSGKYTLTIKGDKIHDTSVERNSMKEASFELDTLDTLAPSVTAVRYGGDKDTNKIYVEFSEDMKTEGEGSILDKSLYHLNYTQDTKNDADVNKTLDEIEDAKIDLDGKNAVIITLPENIKGAAPEVKVGRVCDANGNFVAISGIEYILGAGVTAKNDNTVAVLNGSQLDESDLLKAKTNVNILSDKKMEVYLQGKVSSVVAEGIKATIGGNEITAAKAKAEACTLKVKEGQYVEATKLTVEFENAVFANSVAPTAINFEKETFTTNLETKSKKADEAIVLTATNKKAVEYVKDSAKIFVDENQIATKIQFKLNTKIQPINKDTFSVEGYVVDEAKVEDDGYTVTLTLDKKGSCMDADGEAEINVNLVNPIYNENGDKTVEIDEFQIEKVVREVTLTGGVDEVVGVEAKDATAGTQEITVVAKPTDNSTLTVGDVNLVFGPTGTTKDGFELIDTTTNTDANSIATAIKTAVAADKNVTAAVNGAKVTFTTKATGAEATLDAKTTDSTNVTIAAAVAGKDKVEAVEAVAGVKAKNVLAINQVPVNGTTLVVGENVKLVFGADKAGFVKIETAGKTVEEIATAIKDEMNKAANVEATVAKNEVTIVAKAAGVAGNKISVVFGR